MRQIFEISNKQIELDEEQVAISKGSPGTQSVHFELHAEQLLMDIAICHNEDESSEASEDEDGERIK